MSAQRNEHLSLMMDYMLEYTIPKGEKTYNPYRVFLANFTLQIINKVDRNTVERMISRAGFANENTTLSYQEIMNDLWGDIEKPYNEAVRLATTMGDDYINFSDPTHNVNLDLVTRSFHSVLETIYLLDKKRKKSR